MQKKAKMLVALVLAFMLSISVGAGVVYAGMVSYPNLSTDDTLTEIGNGEITALEVNELKGVYPYGYAGQTEVAWVDYVLHELTTSDCNPIGAQNDRAWVTRDNNKNSTSWLRHFFNGEKKIKQVVLLAPSLSNLPDGIDFIYSRDAQKDTVLTDSVPATTDEQEWAWNRTINGTWAHAGNFAETEWTEATTVNTRDSDYTWSGYKKIVTFEKAICATAITTLLTKGEQAIRLNYIRFYQDVNAEEVATDKFYTYNYDYTAEVSDQAATTDNAATDTGAQGLNDGILGDLFADANVRYGRWLSENAVAGGHTVTFERNSELNVGGVAMHVGADKNFFPSDFTIENREPDSDEWTTVASYSDYKVTAGGWQYFMFVTPAIGDIRLVISDERYVEIAEAVMLETAEKPRTVTEMSLAENSFPSTIEYGGELDFTNAKLDITYSDGATETVNVTASMVSGYDKTRLGKQTVTVKYGKKTVTFEIEVSDVLLSIKANISKTEYKLGETLNLSDATVGILYASGATESVPLTAEMVTGFDSATAGTKTLTVTYGDLTCTKQITVVDYVTGISATWGKTAYNVGDAIDLTGAKLEVTYASGAREQIDIVADMVTGFDSSEEGTKTLTVTYQGFTDTCEITVSKVPEPNTGDGEDNKPENNGCGSSVMTTSAALAAVALFASLVFVKKKR